MQANARRRQLRCDVGYELGTNTIARREGRIEKSIEGANEPFLPFDPSRPAVPLVPRSERPALRRRRGSSSGPEVLCNASRRARTRRRDALCLHARDRRRGRAAWRVGEIDRERLAARTSNEIVDRPEQSFPPNRMVPPFLSRISSAIAHFRSASGSRARARQKEERK